MTAPSTHAPPAGVIALRARPRPASDARRRLPIAGVAAAAGSLTIVGASAPWLSLFAGLQPIRGTDGGNGMVLVALGAFLTLLAAAHLAAGGTWSRWAIGGAGFAILGVGSFLGVAILEEITSLAADPLLVARLEPGLGAVLLGGSLSLATLFVPDDRQRANTARAGLEPGLGATHVALGALVALAGAVHLALTLEHLGSSVVLGIGFLVVGLLQAALAPLILMARTRAVILATLVVSAGSAVALLAAVTVGLPLLGHGPVAGPFGPVEPLDDLGALTGLAEVVAAGLSVRLLRRA